MPSGVIDAAASERMTLENYVAVHGTLPPGTVAPPIDLVLLDDGRTTKLSDLRGQVVVLDFWDTTCAACQQPMADMQRLITKHPEWKDRVKVVTMSIDPTAERAREHLTAHGWTKTLNAWAGPGDWSSEPATQFRVTGIPVTYIIGRDGKILVADHPGVLDIEDAVAGALK
jgi:cytochrome oxidase Cu insertion factor (SCO1/SenC/PrrC family)